MKARAIDASGNQRSTSRASPMCKRMFAKFLVFDFRKNFDDAVFEWLAADDGDGGIVLRLPDQMFAAAEADFEKLLLGALRLSFVRAGRKARYRSSATRGNTSRINAAWRSLGLRPRRRPNERSSQFRLARRSVTWLHSHTYQTERPHEAAVLEVMCRPASANQPTAFLIAGARSVFSQENPPSLSAGRPKWP